VQVGGPSGVCIDPSQFARSISFEDLPTGGAMIVIGENRDLLKEFVMNYTNFFIEESCGSCGPCRTLTVILRNKLQKIMDGKGVKADIDELYEWGNYMKQVNRCGPILTTIENFRPLYEGLIKTDDDFVSTFNMEKAVAGSCKYVGRVPNL
jgi:[NiFe] hydrogenase diaphorase moiety large subunit